MSKIDADSSGLERIIQDHLRLVYSAALRQVRDAHLAEDVTQAVFILFLKKHRAIPSEHIVGWLVKTTHYTSQQAMRATRRRHYHEKQAAMNTQISSNQTTTELAEILDRGLSRLGLRTRTAVALRYLEGQPVGDVAQKLGVSENAASKIILRGISKLRRFLSSRNPTLSLAPAAFTAALGEIAARNSSIDLSHLSITICSHGIGGTTASTALAHAATRLMLWAKIQTAATISCTILIVAGTGMVAAHQAGWITQAATTRPSRLQFRLVEKTGAPSTRPFTLMDDPFAQRPNLRVNNQILLDESEIAYAEEIPDQQGPRYSIAVHFTSAGAQKLSEITAQNIGRRLAIIFDGKLLSAPTIQSQLGSTGVITGGPNGFSKSEADAIVAALGGNRPIPPATLSSAQIVIRDLDQGAKPPTELTLEPSEFLYASTFFALAPTEFLYASTFAAPSNPHGVLNLIVTGDRIEQWSKFLNSRPGGLFLNNRLLARGKFSMFGDALNSDIIAVLDPPADARVIAEQINRATPDNGYKRFLRLYALQKGHAIRHILPPYPPERNMYAIWPIKISPNYLFICRMRNGVPEQQQDYVSSRGATKPVTISLMNILHDVGGLKSYQFIVDPSLRKIELPGDFVVDADATLQARLAALQQIFSTETGRPITIAQHTLRRPVILAIGDYEFAPLTNAKDAGNIAFTADSGQMRFVQFGGSGTWQAMLDALGDFTGMRLISEVDNPPAQIQWDTYPSVWTVYDWAKQTTDQTKLKALLKNLSAQTNLDFKIETRDEPTYVISPGP